MSAKFQVIGRLERLAQNGFWKTEAGLHSLRVGKKLALCSEDLGFTSLQLRRAGELHDVGKALIDQNILYKQGRLTDEERVYVGQHALRGYQLLKGENRMVREAARHHHDVNANGEIWIQVLHLIDIEDALSNRRCYKAAMPESEVRKILEEEALKMNFRARVIFWAHWGQFLALNQN